ncbi:probable cytochrome P450 CYP44 [Caerostris extrusa]|uniref:Probable cytochrome P450 CYP44 n=1 Tax=Caerostris extrusa TaxID=172846 RepID=A0AAV4S0M1_CAEEX|nr:probable cytochrome P450 CYP44 [Caerostris extrusa]
MIRCLIRSAQSSNNTLQICICRTASSQRSYSVSSETKEKNDKPFSSVPAPPRLPLIGHLHLFRKRGRPDGPVARVLAFGALGMAVCPYSFERLYDAYADLYKQCGPIVRLDLGIKMLLLFRPEDIAMLFADTNELPQRPLFEALRHYRLKRKNLYSCAGLTTENGEEWWRLRQSVQFLMHPTFSKSYFSLQEQIAEDFGEFINRTKDQSGIVQNFLQDIYRYTEEAVGLVCFGKRLNLFPLHPGEEETDFSKQLTQAADDTLKSMADTLLGTPWWKIFPTPTYKKLARAQDFFQRFAAKCIDEAKSKLSDPQYKDDGKLELIKKLFQDKNLKPNDISLLMTELFSAGIDATGNAIGFTLYNLTKKLDVQEKLFQDIQKHAPNGLTAESIANMKYLKACIQESHRLTPAVGGIARILQRPTVLSGYKVPPKVLCIGLQPIIARQEQYFDDPLDFKPERWLDETQTKFERKSHPYIVTPFSHGLRRCIGQRFAEQEINLCIVKIIQKFRIEYDGPEIGFVMRMSLVPDKPLNLKFIPRK